MSPTMHIDTDRAFAPGELEPLIGECLRRILNVSREWRVTCADDWQGADSGVLLSSRKPSTSSDESSFYYSIEDLHGMAHLFHNAAVPGDVAYVTIGPWGRPEHAMLIAAAVGAAASDLCGTPIGDGGHWVSRSGLYPSAEFIRAFQENPEYGRAMHDWRARFL
jgi:hypothetical protein